MWLLPVTREGTIWLPLTAGGKDAHIVNDKTPRRKLKSISLEFRLGLAERKIGHG
jgi:hypothetical protein